ncbi:HK97 family phage prohead protease [Alsobacter soli]|uniref:HK97 family phage prohead protease n=1 Tax=Alsobacter soli TaxID=2109933 RepID=UPI003CC9A11B
MEVRDARLALAAPPGPLGVFEGYASLFGVVDLGRDMILPGAFADSLARRGAGGVRLLWQHDPAEPVGAWTVLREDGRGLFARGRLNLGVARARELLALMRQGAVDGLSIGFKAGGARTDPRSGVRRIAKVDLWEISLVTFPLLPQARVTAVKGR